MKKIEGLNDRIVPIADEPGASEAMPTIRQCLMLNVGKGSAKTADEARRITRIVNKLRGDHADVELADEEYNLLIAKIIANAHGYIADIQGQLLEKLDPSKE